MKGGNSVQLRGEIQHLVQAREALQNNADISGSMVKITRTLNAIKPLMSKQSEYIKTFLQGSEASDQTSKESETRRYIARICDIVLNEVNEILTVAEGFFTVEKGSWAKVRVEFERSVAAEREAVDKGNVIELLFRVMNLKERLMKEFMRSLLYRKCLLWKDLNIVSEGFVHAEKKRTTKSIEDLITTKRYAPTRPPFALPAFNTPGQWSLTKQELEDASTAEFLRLLNEQLEEAFQTIRNYSGLTSEQRDHQDIRRNEVQVLSLRAEVEQGQLAYAALEKKYREACYFGSTRNSIDC